MAASWGFVAASAGSVCLTLVSRAMRTSSPFCSWVRRWVAHSRKVGNDRRAKEVGEDRWRRAAKGPVVKSLRLGPPRSIVRHPPRAAGRPPLEIEMVA